MDTLDRMAAASWAAALVKRSDVLYLDTETTGLGNDAEIVDIAVIDSSGRIILNALVRPSGRILREASDVHGIDDRMVADARTSPEVYPKLALLLQARPTVVVYNAAYDTRIISQVNRRHLREVFADWQCAMLQYGAFDGEWNPRHGNYRWHKLEVAARKLGVPMP
jgi:DNA polymerase-3 subunit epsilon